MRVTTWDALRLAIGVTLLSYLIGRGFNLLLRLLLLRISDHLHLLRRPEELWLLLLRHHHHLGLLMWHMIILHAYLWLHRVGLHLFTKLLHALELLLCEIRVGHANLLLLLGSGHHLVGDMIHCCLILPHSTFLSVILNRLVPWVVIVVGLVVISLLSH